MALITINEDDLPKDSREDINDNFTYLEGLVGNSDYLPSGETLSTVGGLTAGTDLGTTKITTQEVLDYMLYPYVSPGITLSTSPSTGTREFGDTSASVELTAVTVKHTDDITLVTYYRGASLIETEANPIPGGGSEDYTDPTTLATTTTYTAHVGDGTTEITSNSKTFTFVYPYYWGVGAQGLTGSQIAGLTKSVSSSGNKTVTTSPSSQVYYFAYPLAYPALTSILDPNSFEIISDYTVSTKSITGLDGTPQDYRVYEFNNLTSQTSFSITYKQ
jgi:hypothetical protein